jgi:mono/diheme cytochrome c family protein
MRFLSFVGALAIAAAVVAAGYFFGGFYDVAAIEPDPEIVAWVIGHIRDASINRHGTEKPPISMTDPTIIRTGARAYASRGCTNCHGGPGVMRAKFAEGMHPAPPDLSDAVKQLGAEQIFWVIRNGIDMSAMPGFSLVDVSDREIWTIAAFVKQLPTVSDEDYRAWTVGAVAPATPAAEVPPK